MKLKEKDKIPNSEIFVLENGEPVQKNIEEFLKNKKVIIFGLPGAYTSVCSAKHLPGYVNNIEKFRQKGIDQIICISVNDPFVMNAWGEANNAGGKITMLSDPYLLFTKAIGAEVDRNSKGMGIRSNRYAMGIENLEVSNIQVEKETKECGLSSAEGILDIL